MKRGFSARVFALFAASVVASSALVVVAAGPSNAARRPNGALPATSVLAVDGHGWGHGHGMGQYGAIGYAKAGKNWTTILSTYYPGTSLANRAAETIRVFLRESNSVVITR